MKNHLIIIISCLVTSLVFSACGDPKKTGVKIDNGKSGGANKGNLSKQSQSFLAEWDKQVVANSDKAKGPIEKAAQLEKYFLGKLSSQKIDAIENFVAEIDVVERVSLKGQTVSFEIYSNRLDFKGPWLEIKGNVSETLSSLSVKQKYEVSNSDKNKKVKKKAGLKASAKCISTDCEDIAIFILDPATDLIIPLFYHDLQIEDLSEELLLNISQTLDSSIEDDVGTGKNKSNFLRNVTDVELKYFIIPFSEKEISLTSIRLISLENNKANVPNTSFLFEREKPVELKLR